MSAWQPVVVVRRPAGHEEEWPCNCHPADKYRTAVVVELGNEASSHTVRLCADGWFALQRQVDELEDVEPPYVCVVCERPIVRMLDGDPHTDDETMGDVHEACCRTCNLPEGDS